VRRVNDIAKRFNADRIWVGYPCFIGKQTALNYYGYYPLKRFGYRELNIVTMIKDLTSNSDLLFKSLNSDCRRMIRRCEKEGGTFYKITDRDEWLHCYDLNLQTLGERAYSLEAMEIVWDQFVEKGIATITSTRLKGRNISVIVTTGMNKSCYWWIGFNTKPQVLKGANNFVLWNTMLLYKEMGVKFFEIGGMEFLHGKKKNISKFKESFNGTPTYLLSGVLELKLIKKTCFELLRVMRQSIGNTFFLKRKLDGSMT
jgi:hypothetical protein